MTKAERIPLFPLEVVLFPGTPLPLHIFEPRYKLLINRCLESQTEFGVILARSEGIASVGCTADIARVLKKYPDGRMDILTTGQAPYRVLEVLDEQPYLEGEIEYLEDTGRPGGPSTTEKLIGLYQQCHTLIYGRAPELPEPEPELSTAYRIAAELPLDLEYKQELLEMRAEAERQESLVQKMELWLPQLAHLHRMRKRAGGNGHG